MNNIVINYKKLVNLIAQELDAIRQSDEMFSSMKVFIEDEQTWVKETNRDANAIYIIVHFGESSSNFGQAVVPVTLEVFGLNNEIELTQMFLEKFTNTYNRYETADDITQLYVSPSKSQSFNEVYDGFRALLSITGTFLLSDGIVKLTKLTYYYMENDEEKSEEIDVFSYNDGNENSLNPQPFPDNKGRTRSYASFQTFAFTITTYPDGNKQLIKDIWAFRFDDSKSHQNDSFVFSGTFRNSLISMPKWSFKCKSISFDQKLGDIPVISIGFSL